MPAVARGNCDAAPGADNIYVYTQTHAKAHLCIHTPSLMPSGTCLAGAFLFFSPSPLTWDILMPSQGSPSSSTGHGMAVPIHDVGPERPRPQSHHSVGNNYVTMSYSIGSWHDLVLKEKRKKKEKKGGRRRIGGGERPQEWTA